MLTMHAVAFTQTSVPFVTMEKSALYFENGPTHACIVWLKICALDKKNCIRTVVLVFNWDNIICRRLWQGPPDVLKFVVIPLLLLRRHRFVPLKNRSAIRIYARAIRSAIEAALLVVLLWRVFDSRHRKVAQQQGRILVRCWRRCRASATSRWRPAHCPLYQIQRTVTSLYQQQCIRYGLLKTAMRYRWTLEMRYFNLWFWTTQNKINLLKYSCIFWCNGSNTFQFRIIVYRQQIARNKRTDV